VLAQCRAHALTIAEPFGVWGGLSETERARMLTSRRYGRSELSSYAR
jgi:WhiB family redox-sensing transcriptional regulator